MRYQLGWLDNGATSSSDHADKWLQGKNHGGVPRSVIFGVQRHFTKQGMESAYEITRTVPIGAL